MALATRGVLLALLALFAFPSLSQAQYIWNNTESGIWNRTSNWTGGIPVSGTTATVSFGGTSTYSSLDDITGAFILNQLNLNGTAANTQITVGTLSPATGLSFGGTSPSLTIASTSTANYLVSAPTTLTSGWTVNNGGSGILYYSGAISAATFPITFNNTGGSGNTFVTGATTFTGAGQAINMTGTGTGNTTITGAITFAGAASTITNSSATGLLTVGAVAIGTNQTLTINANGGNVLGAGVISGSGPVTGVNTPAVSITGAGTVVLTGANTFAAGTAGTSSQLQIQSGATLGFTGDTALGAAPGVASTARSTVINDGTLRALTTVTLSANRGITLQGATNNTISIVGNQTLAASAVMNSETGTTPLTITGGGIFNVTAGTSTFTGNITVNNGSTLRVFGDGAFGAAANQLTLGDATTSGTLLVTTASTLGATRTFNVAAGGGTLATVGVATVYGGNILAGTNALTFAGGNTFTLTAAATTSQYTAGSVTINSGTSVNYTFGSALTAPFSGTSTNLVFSGASANNTSNFALGGGFSGGGQLQITNVAAGPAAASQAFNNLTVNAGTAILFPNGIAGKTVDVNFNGTFTRNSAGAVIFVVPNAQSTITSNFATNNPASVGVGNLLGGWATFGTTANPTDFASVNAGNQIVALAAYTNFTWSTGTNTQINGATTTTIGSGASTGSLLITTGATAAASLTLSGANVISSGGILVGSGLTTAQTFDINGSATNTLTAGSNNDLIITNASGAAQTVLRISGGIVENGNSGGMNLVKSGQGTLALNATAGASTFAGTTYIQQGVLRLDVNNTLPTTTPVVMTTGSTLTLNTGIAQQIGSLTGNGTVGLGTGAGGKLTINGSTSTTFAGLISGTSSATGGLVVSGSQTLTLLAGYNGNAAGTFTANTAGLNAVVINSGATVQIFADTALGAAPGSNVAGRNYVNLAGGTLLLNGSPGYSANRGIVLNASSTIAAAANSIPTISPVINIGANTLTYTANSGALMTASGALFFSGNSNALNANATLSNLGIGSVTVGSNLNYTGAATLTLGGSGYVTFSGTQLLSGALSIVNNNTNTNANTNANASVVIGGTITAGGNSISITNSNAANTTISATTTFTTPVSITNAGSGTGATVYSGGITLAGPSSLTVTNNASTILTMSGALSAGIGSLTVNGTGTTLYTGGITFTGPSSITVPSGTGTVQFGAITTAVNGPSTFTNNSSNPVAVNGTLTNAANTVLTFNGTGTTNVVGSYTMGNTSVLRNTGSGGVNITTLNQGGGNNTYINSGSGAVNFFNVPGTQNALFYGGGTFNMNGQINFNNNTQLGWAVVGNTVLNFPSSSTIIHGAGTGGADYVNYSTNTLTINSGTYTGNDFPLQFQGTNNIVITPNITGTGATTGTITSGNWGTVTLNGNNGMGGNVTLTNGKLVLNGTNSFGAAAVLSMGVGSTLEFSASNQLGAPTGVAGNITLAGGTLSLTTTGGSGAFTPGTGAAPGTTVSASSTINVTNTGNTLTFPGAVSLAAFTLQTTGAGNVTLGATTTLSAASGSLINNGTGTLTVANVTNAVTATTVTFGGSGNITVGGSLLQNAALTFGATFNGNAGSNTGAGVITLNSNTSTLALANTINAGTVVIGTPGGTSGTSGVLGSAVAANTLTLVSGTLQLNPGAGITSTPVGPLSVTAGGTIKVNFTGTPGSGATNQSTLTFTNAAAFAPAAGTSLIINTGTGLLGTTATDDVVITIPSGAPATLNSMVVPRIVGQLAGNTTATFLNYASGFVPVSYNVTSLADGGTNADRAQSSGVALSAPTLAYALQVNGGGNVSGSTSLTLGNGTNAGLILNDGSSISTTTLALAAATPAIYVNGSSSISSTITGSNGFTLFGPGTLTIAGTNSLSAGTIAINTGSTLAVSATSGLNNRALAIQGALSINNGSGNFTSSGAITAAPGGASITVANTSVGSTTFTGGFTSAANTPVSLTNNSAGTLSFTTGVFAFSTGVVNANGGTITISSAYTATTAGVNVLNVNNGATVNLNYTGAANPNTAATVYSGGTLNLQTPNTTGTSALNALFLAGGTTKFLNNTNTGTAAMVAGVVTVNTGAILDVNGFSGVIGGLVGGSTNGQLTTYGNGTTLLATSTNSSGNPFSGGSITNNASTSPAATLTFGHTADNTTRNLGVVFSDTAVDSSGGNGTLNINLGGGSTGNGRVYVLTAASTFHGTLTAGTLPGLSNNGNSLLIGHELALQNATLVNNLLTSTTAGVAFSTGANSGTASFGVVNPVIGAISGFGNLILPNQYINVSVGSNNQSTAYSGVISGGQASLASLIKTGTGTMTLANQNTFAGIAGVTGGTLALGVPNALIGGLPTQFVTNFPAGQPLNVASIRDLLPAPGVTTIIPSSGQVLSVAFIPSGSTAGNTLNPTGSGVINTYSLSQVALSIQGDGTINTGTYPNASLFLTGTVSNTFAGALTGSGGITKTNTSTQILTGVGLNTYSGATTLIGGTLQASFTNLSGTNTNILSPNSTVVFENINGANANGTLLITASNVSSSVSNQTVAGLTMNSNTIGRVTLANPVFDATLNFTITGSITRNAGSVLNITTPSIGTVLTSTAAVPTGIQQLGGGTINVLTSQGTANQILTDTNGSAYVTFPTDWAVKNAANTQLMPASQVAGFTYTGNAITTGSNTLVTASFTQTTGTTFNSLHFASGAASTITLGAAQNYVISTGGILQSNAATAAGTIGAAVNQGTLTSATNELIVTNYPNQGMTINSTIGNNGANPTGLTVNFQQSTLTLAGTNTFTGPINIAAGGLTITGSIDTVSAINNYGGTLTLNKTTAGGLTMAAPITGTGALTNTSSQAVVLTGTINLAGAITNNLAGANLTIGTSGGSSNTLIGSGSLVNTAGTLTLNTPNIYTGVTTLTAGSTTIMNSLSMQNSVVTATLANASPTEAGNALHFGTSGSPLTAATFSGLAGAGNLVLNTPAGTAVAVTVGTLNGATAPTGFWSGLGSVNKIGTGALTFTNTAAAGHTYTGATTFQGGAVAITFLAAGTTKSVLYDGVTAGALTLGGTFTSLINGSTIPTQAAVTITSSTAAGSNTQNFGSVAIAANSYNTLTLTTVAGVTLNTGFGATLTRSTGGFLSVIPAAVGTNNITLTAGTASTILTSGGNVVGQIGNNDWLAKNAGNTNVVGLSTVSGYGTVNASASATNWDFNTSSTATTNTANTIRANAGTVTLTLAAGATTVTAGGVMLGAGGGGTFTVTAASGTNSITGGNGELIFLTNRGSSIVIGAIASPTLMQIVGSGLAVTSGGASANGLIIRSFPTYTGATIGLNNLQAEFAGTWLTSNIVNQTQLTFNQTLAQASGDGGAAGTITYNGVISGTGTLIQGNTGITILGGANTYTGTTSVNAGTLRLNNAAALPSTTSLTMNAAAASPVLDLNGLNATVGALTGNVSAGFGSSTLPIIRNGVGSTTSILTVGNLGYNTQFAGTIVNGTGTVGLTKTGTGQLTLTGLNTYTGTTTVNNGVLSVATTGSLGTGPVVLNNTNTSAGRGTVLSLSNATQTIGSLSSGTIATPSSGSNFIQLSVGPNSTLTINQTTPGTFAGNITGATGAVVLGAGSTNSLSLTAPNYYGGGTTINGGTLLANNSTGSATGTGSVVVNNGGRLGGGNLAATVGFVGGPVTINNGGILSPGNSPGVLTIGNVLTMNVGSALNWEISNGQTPVTSFLNGGSNTASQDLVSILGSGNTFIGNGTSGTPTVLNLIQDGIGTVNLVNGQSYSFTLISLGAGTTAPTLGTFSVNTSSAIDFANYANANGGDGAITIVSDLSGVYLNVAPVPEPASIGLIATIGLGVGGCIRRRFRRQAA